MHDFPEVTLSGSLRPVRVLALPEPPDILFVRGELPRGPAVAVVGTRSCSTAAFAFARNLAKDLTEAGITVLSGGAEGIDTAAHEGALDAGGATVVVAPSGFERPFPAKNADLFRRVLVGGGAYVSLVPGEFPANRGSFFPRNALLVALAHALVVVEAGYRSGARNAAAQARKLGRSLFVVPHAPWNSRGLGCIEELKQGGRPIKDARDVLRGLRADRLHPLPFTAPGHAVIGDEMALTLRSPPSSDAELSDSTRVLAEVARGHSAIDDLCSATGLGVAEIQQILLRLRLRGALIGDGRGGLCLPST